MKNETNPWKMKITQDMQEGKSARFHQNVITCTDDDSNDLLPISIYICILTTLLLLLCCPSCPMMTSV